MSSFWQQLTLSTLPLQQWREVSYLHFLVGPLRNWRRGSRLMQWADWIGLGLISLVFGLAPFVSNTLLAVLLSASAIFWVLLTLSDDVSVDLGEQSSPEESETLSGRGKAALVDWFAPAVGTPLVTPIHLLVLLYWGISVVATAFSPVKQAALIGLNKLTLYLLFFALMARVLRSPRARTWIITVYLLAALIVSVYGLQQWFSGTTALATWVDPMSPLSKTTRVYSFLGNPNLLAAYLIPSVVFSILAIFIWPTWMTRGLAAVMAIVNGSCLVLTFSRGGWIGLTVSILVLSLLLGHWWSVYLPRFWRTWAVPLVVAGAASVLILGVVFVEPLRDRVFSMFSGRGDSSNNYRINVWQAVIEMIQDRPLLGIGLGNTAFNKIYPLYQRPRFSALSAYSIILEVAVETGIIGLTCFLWLLLVIFTQGWTQLQRLRDRADRQGYWLMGAIATLLGLLGHGLFDTVLYRPDVNTLWWLMIAMIASFSVRPTPSTIAIRSGL